MTYSKEQQTKRPDKKGKAPKPKIRTCKTCKNKFEQVRSNQIVCSPKCAYEYSKKQTERKKKQAKILERKRIREEKEKLKTLGSWRKDLQGVINKIVRQLDEGKNCLIRPNENVRHFDASHFYSIGSAEHLRFSVKNIYLSGTKSNRELGGETNLMRIGLIDRYGQKWVDEIDFMFHFYSGIRLRIHDIKRAIKIARQILRELKRGAEMSRDEVEKRIGIYDKHFDKFASVR